MTVSKELRNLLTIVEEVLTADIEARGNNDYLYYLVCKEVARDRGVELDNLKFTTVLTNRKLYCFPPYESVTRVRRRVQASNYDLLPSEKVEKLRRNRELSFERWATNGNEY